MCENEYLATEHVMKSSSDEIVDLKNESDSLWMDSTIANNSL